MKKYTVVRTDLMTGTHSPSHLRSIEIPENIDVENGSIVKVGDLADGSREMRECLKPTGTEKLSELAVIATPELMYDERKKFLYEFINKAGSKKGMRGYLLSINDIFSITKEGFSENTRDNLAVGKIVELIPNSFKVAAVDENTEGRTKIGKIIDSDNGYYAIEICE